MGALRVTRHGIDADLFTPNAERIPRGMAAYGIGDWGRSLGNHRARVRVTGLAAIALASWAKAPVTIRLDLDTVSVSVPAISFFQEGREKVAIDVAASRTRQGVNGCA